MKTRRSSPPTSTARARGRAGHQTYRALYLTLTEFLPNPDLMIYLRASAETLQNRIRMRNRSYERAISSDYLEQLNDLYEQWIAGFTLCPVLTVPADDLDYVAHPRHLDLILSKVRKSSPGRMRWSSRQTIWPAPVGINQNRPVRTISGPGQACSQDTRR